MKNDSRNDKLEEAIDLSLDLTLMLLRMRPDPLNLKLLAQQTNIALTFIRGALLPTVPRDKPENEDA
jgi:hypothetical protein